MRGQYQRCYICEGLTRGEDKTKHHLIPKAVEGDFKPEELRKVITVHRTCHQKIHKFFSNIDLAYKFNDPEKLKKEFKRRQKLNSQGKYKNHNYPVPVDE